MLETAVVILWKNQITFALKSKNPLVSISSLRLGWEISFWQYYRLILLPVKGSLWKFSTLGWGWVFDSLPQSLGESYRLAAQEGGAQRLGRTGAHKAQQLQHSS